MYKVVLKANDKKIDMEEIAKKTILLDDVIKEDYKKIILTNRGSVTIYEYGLKPAVGSATAITIVHELRQTEHVIDIISCGGGLLSHHEKSVLKPLVKKLEQLGFEVVE